MYKAVILDRDGVLNTDLGTYAYRLEELRIEEGVPQALQTLKSKGYLLIVITNQAGIAKGLYTSRDVIACYHKIQQACGNVLDGLYFSPYHPDYSASLGRKPGYLLFERAIAKYRISVNDSWMVGDKERDLIPAAKVGIPNRVLISHEPSAIIGSIATHRASSLLETVNSYILRV